MAKSKKNTISNSLDIYDNKQVALSNALIQAREKTSLLESKIELLAIYKMKDEMQTIVKIDSRKRPYSVHKVEIESSEIRQLMGRTGGSLYERIEAAALELKQKLYIYRDPEKNQFTMDNLYGEVTYKNGTLGIEFNPATEYLFTELKNNFTKIRLDIAFRFQTNGGFQLYKLLKSYVYTLPEVNLNLSQEEQPFITKHYSLSELRLQLGYVDLNQPELKREGAKAHPDIEKMTALEKKPKYKRWIDFYNRVISPGIKEVNEISDIYIVSIEKQCIAHGKIDGVTIKIQNNKSFYEKAVDNGTYDKWKEEKKTTIPITEAEKDDFIDEMRNFIKEDLKTRDLKAVAEAAVYDIEKIKKAYQIMLQSGEIENVTGFLIKAIEDRYEMPVKAKKQDGGFNDFTQRSYNYDELEKILLET